MSAQEALLDKFLADTAPKKSQGADLLDQFLADTAPPAETPDFLKPRPIPGVPGMGGENLPAPTGPSRPADIPAPAAPENPTLGQMILPKTLGPKAQVQQPVYAPDGSGRVDSYVPVTPSAPLESVGDLAGVPTRFAGAATDPILPGNARGNNADGSRKSFSQAMADPETGVMRPAREGIAESIKTAWEYAKDDEKPYLMRALAAVMGAAAVPAYLGASAVEDPTVVGPVVAPMVATPKVMEAAGRMGSKLASAGRVLAEAPNKLGGMAAEEMSGASQEALRMAGTAEGRAALQQAAGRQKEIGDAFLARITNADDALTEEEKVREALAGMGPISTEGVIKALEDAKPKAIAGRLTDADAAANKKIDTYIDFLRGGPKAEPGKPLPTLPSPNVDAPQYRQLRQKLDANIDFDTEEGPMVNSVLKAGRRNMKETLVEKARARTQEALAAGNKEDAEKFGNYEKWMQSYSDKLDKLDRIKDMLGGKADTRAARIERFMSTLFGKNTEYKQQLVRDLDEIFGTDILGEAKTASLAAELGKGGKASLFPRQFNGRSVMGIALSHAVAPFFASPLVASRFTLPFLQGMEGVLKKTGGNLSGRALMALRAASKARNAAVQMRLLNVIQKDAIPEVALPMNQVAVSDQTRTRPRRFAAR